MFEVLVLSMGLLLSVAACYYFIKARRLSDYKELFELGDAEYKKAQEDIKSLLQAQNNKNIIIDRAAKSLEEIQIKVRSLEDEKLTLQQTLEYQKEQYDKLIGQKKSSEVRTGKIAEQMAPFLENYPLPSKTARFIGDPIDFVHFDEESVTFVEVKSGKSQLNKNQRRIRDLIKDGKVEFVIYRVEGEK